ncbi:hypothetical protein HanOQP8_Chr12g0437311 [Helianthus annuus]|nr:hypothetical protein HanOQP8_Chr12g0437311 [Helianthus annuus]
MWVIPVLTSWSIPRLSRGRRVVVRVTASPSGGSTASASASAAAPATPTFRRFVANIRSGTSITIPVFRSGVKSGTSMLSSLFCLINLAGLCHAQPRSGVIKIRKRLCLLDNECNALILFGKAGENLQNQLFVRDRRANVRELIVYLFHCLTVRRHRCELIKAGVCKTIIEINRSSCLVILKKV